MFHYEHHRNHKVESLLYESTTFLTLIWIPISKNKSKHFNFSPEQILIILWTNLKQKRDNLLIFRNSLVSLLYHIDKTLTKIRHSLGFLCRIRSCLSIQGRIKSYNSRFSPILSIVVTYGLVAVQIIWLDYTIPKSSSQRHSWCTP